LADSGNGVKFWVKVRAEEGLDLLEQCCLSGVVESKKENGILWLVASAKVKSRLFVRALSYLLCLSRADRATSPDDTYSLQHTQASTIKRAFHGCKAILKGSITCISQAPLAARQLVKTLLAGKLPPPFLTNITPFHLTMQGMQGYFACSLYKARSNVAIYYNGM